MNARRLAVLGSFAACLLSTACAPDDASPSGDESNVNGNAKGNAPASNELSFHAEVKPFEGVDFSSGMQPAASPVQMSLSFKVDGALTVDAAAIGGGSSDAPKVAGKAGSGKQKIAATLKADAQMKVDLPGMKYEGELPGMEALAIAMEGTSAFDPFLLDGSSLATADVPETTLPPIPLPGGIPGSVVITIEKGSVVHSDFHGTCANVTAGDAPTASYQGAAKLDADLVVHASIELHGLLSKTFDVPSFHVNIPAHEVALDLGSPSVTLGGDVAASSALMKVGSTCGSPSSSGPASTDPPPPDGNGTPPSDDGGPGTPPPPTTCNAVNACTAAFDIGTLAGDAAGTGISVDGSTARWLEFRAKEIDGSTFGAPMKVRVVLDAPAGWSFRAHMNTTTDVSSACGTTTYAPTSNVLTLAWGEGGYANGSDDSRNIAIEIQDPSGACPSDFDWKLDITHVQ